jgi:EpsI family protein
VIRLKHISWRFLAAFIILTATLAASRLAERRHPESLAHPLTTIPDEIVGWRKVGEEPLSERVLGKLTPTSYLSRTYQKGGQQLGLFIAYYAQQRAGESMHSPKHCLPGAGWEIWDYGSAMVPVDGSELKINRYSIQNSGNRALVLYWYQSRRRIIASEYLGKILLVGDALFNGGTSGSIVRVIVQDNPGATAAGVAFASQVIPQVADCFGR